MAFGGGRGGRGGGRGGHNHNSGRGNDAQFKLCSNYIVGKCTHGDRCRFAHLLQIMATVDCSDKNKEFNSNNNYNNRNYHSKKKMSDRYKASSVAVWENQGQIKVFTGSYDGKWRLFNTGPAQPGQHGAQINQEFEHYVGGPIDVVHVASHYFFCAFECAPAEAPDSKAGMVHIWNLNNPSDPPMELWMSPMSKYAGSGKIRSLFTTPDGTVWSGGSDGIIRQWAFNPQGPDGKPGFVLTKTYYGHLGAVTGIALVKGNLWSSGMDGTLRIWNCDKAEQAHLIPANKNDRGNQNNGNPTPAQKGPGHSGPINEIVPFELPNDGGSFIMSSSNDGTVKVWNATNGDCVASESNPCGVTSISLTADIKGKPMLLSGLLNGDIMIRGTVSTPPLKSLTKIAKSFLNVGHDNTVNDICTGPGNTFYAVGDDGKLTVWQITGNFQL
mmetsp:Transcript_27875/g.66367  ORF Transcript_27875/g.66367 Transcript_27875/m.66367 type:complete len:441 (+) Transcript_27875:202-1524(+)